MRNATLAVPWSVPPWLFIATERPNSVTTRTTVSRHAGARGLGQGRQAVGQGGKRASEPAGVGSLSHMRVEAGKFEQSQSGSVGPSQLSTCHNRTSLESPRLARHAIAQYVGKPTALGRPRVLGLQHSLIDERIAEGEIGEKVDGVIRPPGIEQGFPPACGHRKLAEAGCALEVLGRPPQPTRRPILGLSAKEGHLRRGV